MYLLAFPSYNIITVKIRISNVIWLFSAVYASPRSAERHILWNNLMKVADFHNMPWVIAGDLNEPLANDDKFGGRVERLDRFFLNPYWCLLCPDAKITHLPRYHYDHCPVLLEMQPDLNGGKKRLFRFQMCWLLDPNFPDVVSQAWGGANNLVEAIDSFTRDVMAWNKN
ncbi:uncharacterized protein LOC142612023 [Castanea sativa]|uniref:uncharacterized protein LOC142612023 n=1 Tax=Castanea sativa TaxID=21020 RepID=UPI003F65492E